MRVTDGYIKHYTGKKPASKTSFEKTVRQQGDSFTDAWLKAKGMDASHDLDDGYIKYDPNIKPRIAGYSLTKKGIDYIYNNI